MNITRWEPFREMEDMLRRFSPFVGSLRGASEGSWTPTADITETEQEYLVKAQLPDVKKEDIHVSVENGVLTLSGERRQEKETKGENDIRIESFYGTFSRSFGLPENCDGQGIRAESKDGVLRVHIPKNTAPKAKPTTIEVK
ncbi:MAG: Hsp20/alpha crystallin family protein [Steroidobacteraceae bacterium]